MIIQREMGKYNECMCCALCVCVLNSVAWKNSTGGNETNSEHVHSQSHNDFYKIIRNFDFSLHSKLFNSLLHDSFVFHFNLPSDLSKVKRRERLGHISILTDFINPLIEFSTGTFFFEIVQKHSIDVKALSKFVVSCMVFVVCVWALCMCECCRSHFFFPCVICVVYFFHRSTKIYFA